MLCLCTLAPCRERAMVTVAPGVWCDPCIAPLVTALNAGGLPTVASCCGHGRQRGMISLADGRELLVVAAGREHRNQLAEAFIRGLEVGANEPDLAGEGDAMYAAFRRWWDGPVAELSDVLA